MPALVALAKNKPSGLSYGSQGVGTAGHLLGELFAKASGAPLVHVPYKGAAQGVVDLVAGRLDMMFIGILPTKPHLESGKLRALAVTSKARLPELPDAPTTAEAGYPDVNTDFVWFGLAAPLKTPDAIVANLHERFTKALTSKRSSRSSPNRAWRSAPARPTNSSRASRPTPHGSGRWCGNPARRGSGLFVICRRTTCRRSADRCRLHGAGAGWR